ncbi:hypothetical protein BASA83_008268 [Batrachochytrium salamandrivorans]|nr:hypothetical protein BASA83_008268 [Batrachochytrium salamandrivorans]
MLLCEAKGQASTLYGLPRSQTRIQLRIGIPYRLSLNFFELVHWQDLYYIGLARCLQSSSHQGGDESKTSVITKYGQFEFLVMPFGLANAPAQFQRMMNSLFRDVIGKHVLVYLDDIVVYSENMSDHIVQFKMSFESYRTTGLYCKAEKCHFYKSEIKYLGYIISADGLRMDPSKSRLFRVGHAKKEPFILETDASDYAISGVLSLVRRLQHSPRSPSSHGLVRSQEPRVLHDDQEVNSSSGSLVSWNYPSTDFSLTHRPGKLNGRGRFHFPRREDYKSNTESSNFQRILDPSKVVDLQSLVADMDLHLLLHSQVLEKVFVLESDWPLIIADFLAGKTMFGWMMSRKSSWRDANGS